MLARSIPKARYLELDSLNLFMHMDALNLPNRSQLIVAARQAGFRSASDTQNGSSANLPVAWLCDNEWYLPVQLFEFESWLDAEGKDLPKGD